LLTLVALLLLAAPSDKAPACPHEMVPRYWLQPIYPKAAVKKKLGGKVQLAALVAADGRVKKVATLSGDEDLADAADDALKEWSFQPCLVSGTPAEVTVAIEFEFHPERWNVTYSLKDPPFGAKSSVSDKPIQRVRVSAGVSAGNLRYSPKPKYPMAANVLAIQGTVVLHVLIGRDGGVTILDVKEGPPELTASAVDAVQQWRYKPYFLNEELVEVDTTVVIKFTLGH